MTNHRPISAADKSPIERLIWLIAEIEVEKYFQEVNPKQPTPQGEQHAGGNLRTI